MIKKILKGVGGLLLLLFLIVLTGGWILVALIPYMVLKRIINHYRGEEAESV